MHKDFHLIVFVLLSLGEPCRFTMQLQYDAVSMQEIHKKISTYTYIVGTYYLSWCGPNYLCSYQDYQVFCNRKYVLKISIADDTLFLSKMRSMDAYTLCNDNPESTKCLVVSG